MPLQGFQDAVLADGLAESFFYTVALAFVHMKK